MKRVLLLGFVFFSLISVVAAAGCPAIPGRHGVEIEGVCYDCGVDDGVCPIDYGATCIERDSDCSYPEASFWSNNGNLSQLNSISIDVAVGGTVNLIVAETGLPEGTEISFDIRENDILFDDDVETIMGTVQSGIDTKAIAVWKISESNIDSINNALNGEDPGEGQFYFSASENGGWESSGISNYLNLTTTYGGIISTSSCSDYTDEDSCNLDPAGVGAPNIPPRTEGSCTYYSSGNCSWEGSTGGSSCQQLIWETADAGNPETCEPPKATPCSYPEETSTENLCGQGADVFTITYSNPSRPECSPWESAPIFCPQEVKVPFFGPYGIVMTLSMISLVYFLFRRKFIR